jgi:hypothetical protein
MTCSLCQSTPYAAIVTYLTETGTLVVKKVLNPSTPHQVQPTHYEDVDTNATGPLSTPPRIPHPLDQISTRPRIAPQSTFIEQEKPAEPIYQRPSRKRLARLTPEQIHQAVVEQNVDLLNEVATQRKLPGYEFTHIAVDTNGKGLCLKASQPIPATPWMNKTYQWHRTPCGPTRTY